MKIKILFPLILIIFVTSTCKKENQKNSAPNTSTEASSYFPLEIGNFWYYDLYKVVDSSGLEEQLNYSDTVRIIGEEMIDGNNYFVIEQDSWLTQNNRKDTLFYRDSSSYLVTPEGNIVFSSVEFNSILRLVDYDPAPWAVEYTVPDTIENHTVPAGTFECLNYRGRVYSTTPNNNYPERFVHNCYSEDVGVVFQSIFFVSQYGVQYERRLADYHLE